MPTDETNTRKIIARLKREGWESFGGAKHDQFVHPKRPNVLVVVPRHRTCSAGVARDAAKKAGWV